MNGTTYLKSRYLTFKAANQRPAPTTGKKTSSKNSGNVTIRQSGRYPYQSMMPAIITSEIAKSIKLVMMLLTGIIMRGKYTLVSRLALPIREPELSERALAKKFQGSMAAKTSNGYGIPSDGSLASSPKTTVKTSIVTRGRITLQATPITVCL